MSEFKGTRGKWVSNGNDVLIDEYSRQIQLEYNCGGFGIEREYNALLISKAPEMLEILQWFVYNFEGVFHEGTETDNKVNEAKELIKQATEI